MVKGKAKTPRARTLINGARQLGTVVEWKNTFGWIQPAKPISHPKMHKQGKVYLAQEDVVEELDGVGASVSFQLYSDSSGLGAADCKMARGRAQASPAASTPASRFKGGASKAMPPRTVPPTWTPSFQKKGAVQKGPTKGAVQKGHTKGNTASTGKGSFGKGGAGKGSEKREIIYNKPLRGTVVLWKGKFGWVQPHDTIDHPAAKAHKGNIFMGAEDVEQEIAGVGATVRFMLYEDGRGLGAANVRPV